MYKILKILGQGSFGQVYLVNRYDNLKKNYAMKKISIYRMKNNFKQSIINEIRILKYSNCPYILNFIDCQYNGTNIDIIIPFIRRGDLHKIINKRRHKKFDEIIIWSYLIQTCLGIQYLHNNNIIHRDLKSSNILINSNDNLYITDFGTCKVFTNNNTDLTRSQVGTPYYFSPELLSQQDYSYKVDIWGIGCLLFEMITFTPPFVASNMKSLTNKILSVNFSRNLKIYSNKYSDSLLSLVDKILIKDEKKRLDIKGLMKLPCISQHLYLIPYTTQKSTNISDFNHKFENITHKTWFQIIQSLRN